MAIPTGDPVNMAYFDSVIARIESCGTCADIQAALDDSSGIVQAQLDSLAERMQMLQPYLALLTPPSANPAQIVTFLTDLIEAQIKPMVAPLTIIPLQIAAYVQLPAKFIAAADAAKARLPSCDITPPVVTPPVIPKAVINFARMKQEGL